MKLILVSFFLFSLSAWTKDTVKDASYMEWLGTNLAGGKPCAKATAEEACLIPGPSTKDYKAIENLAAPILANLQEEDVFNSLALTAHESASCMAKLTNEYNTSPQAKSLIRNQLATSWPSVTNQLGSLNSSIKETEKTLANLRISTSDRLDNNFQLLEKKRVEEKNLAQMNLVRALMISKLPFGDDPVMHKFYKEEGGKSYKEILGKFDGKMDKLKDLAQKSEKHFASKVVSQNPPEYKISNGDKRSLSQAYYPQLLEKYGKQPKLRNGLLCRIDKQYVSGPKAISDTIDKAIIVGSVATLGAGSLVGAAAGVSRAAFLVSRGAQTAGMMMGIASSLKFGSDALQSCGQLAASPLFKLQKTCSVQDVLGYQRIKMNQNDCAYRVALLAFGQGSLVLKNLSKEIKPIVKTGSPQSTIPSMRKVAIKSLKEEHPRAHDNLVKMGIRMGEISPKRAFALETKILNDISDPDLKKGFAIAMRKMNDKKYLMKYMLKLKAETFEAMRRSKDPYHLTLLRTGDIDVKVLERILLKRIRARGVPVVTIKKSLKPEEFNKEIGKGFIIDKGFTKDSSHGVYTHLIQQDLTYDIIKTSSGKSYSDIIKFMGTKKGMDVWDKMYDGQRMSNSMCPEWFGPQLVKGVLGFY